MPGKKFTILTTMLLFMLFILLLGNVFADIPEITIITPEKYELVSGLFKIDFNINTFNSIESIQISLFEKRTIFRDTNITDNNGIICFGT